MATVTPPWAYTLHLPHDPHAPGIARATLRTVLAAHGLAELLASELLTNAHLHTADPYALRLRAMETGRLRLAVWDSDPKIPPAFDTLGPQPVENAENGRGLHIVRECAEAWGAYVMEDAVCVGKLMWAECQ